MPYTKNYDLDTDTTLGGSNASDYVAASQKAIKDYVDNHSGGGGANTDLSNLTATGEAHFLKNTATGTNSLTIGGTSATQSNSINIGYNSSVPSASSGSIVIGTNATSANSTGLNITIGNSAKNESTSMSTVIGVAAEATAGQIALGRLAKVQASNAIQIGNGTNTTPATLQIGFGGDEYDYQLLDGSTGLIPDARISTNIARTSQIPSTSGFEQTSNKVTSITSSSTDIQYPSAKSVIELLKTIYPVGCVYLTTNSTCPLSSLFGTWSLVSSGRALWTGTGSNGNTTIAAGLPNVEGSIKNSGGSGGFTEGSGTGCFTDTTTYPKMKTHAAGGSTYDDVADTLVFHASRSNSIYGNSTTVQPPAYVVNVFRRTA